MIFLNFFSVGYDFLFFFSFLFLFVYRTLAIGIFGSREIFVHFPSVCECFVCMSDDEE